MSTHPCTEVKPLLHVFADGELPAGEQSMVEDHLADCPDCSLEASRDRENGEYLSSVLQPFRMPAGLSGDFLLADGTPAPAAPAKRVPKTTVMGAPPASASVPWKPLLIAGLVVGAGLAAWALLSGDPPSTPGVDPREDPEPGDRPETGKGAADPQPVRKGGGDLPAGDTRVKTTGPARIENARTGDDLVRLVEDHKGRTLGQLVPGGWGILSGQPDEAAPVRAAADTQENASRRAALVLMLGADEHAASRENLEPFLVDAAPAVRISAILGLARSLSWHHPGKQVIPTGAPLAIGVEVGPVEDPGWLSKLADRLKSEASPEVQKVLVLVLSPGAGTNTTVRERLLDGVQGIYGDDLRAECLAAIRRAKSPDALPGLAKALGAPGTPADLVEPIALAMIDCDREGSAQVLSGRLASEENEGRRKVIVAALVRCEVPRAFRALRDILASDREAALRALAARGLAKDPVQETLDALTAAVNDADPLVQRHARRSKQTVEKALAKKE